MSRIPIALIKKATKQVLLTWIGIFSTLLAFRLPSFFLFHWIALSATSLHRSSLTHTHHRVVSLLSGARAPFYVDWFFFHFYHAALNDFLKGKAKFLLLIVGNLKFTPNLTPKWLIDNNFRNLISEQHSNLFIWQRSLILQV